MEKETKMKTYTIYHIPGKKIGCTDNLKRRIRAQKYTDYEILEEHTDKDLAAEREIELQKQYGYKADLVKYNEVDYSSVGRINGITARDSGQLLAAAINGGKTQGRKNVENGMLSIVRIKGGMTKGRKKTSISAYHKETSKYIGTYDSIRKCANYLGINHTHILAYFKGKQKSAGGYTFKKEVK